MKLTMEEVASGTSMQKVRNSWVVAGSFENLDKMIARVVATFIA